MKFDPIYVHIGVCLGIAIVFNVGVGALLFVQRWKLERDRARCTVKNTHNYVSRGRTAD